MHVYNIDHDIDNSDDFSDDGTEDDTLLTLTPEMTNDTVDVDIK